MSKCKLLGEVPTPPPHPHSWATSQNTQVLADICLQSAPSKSSAGLLSFPWPPVTKETRYYGNIGRRGREASRSPALLSLSFLLRSRQAQGTGDICWDEDSALTSQLPRQNITNLTWRPQQQTSRTFYPTTRERAAAPGFPKAVLTL